VKLFHEDRAKADALFDAASGLIETTS